ncbi:MAG: class I SAM-dependent methyltransferase [Candidatus Bathyarchaeia archaeon]|jgi:ubiquinone/menaquinone biosynthesis C-methylase UbiE
MKNLQFDDKLFSQFRRPTGKQGKTIAAIMNKEHDQLTNWGLSHIKIEPNSAILDIGVGGGRTIGKLANLAFEGNVYGIDYSRDMVDFTKTQNQQLTAHGRVNLVQASVEALSFCAGFLDLVIAVETIYFWPNLINAFCEINRVLKQGGKFVIISEMTKDGKYEVENAEIIAKTHVKLYSLAELQGLLEAAGFCVEVSRKQGSAWNVIVAQKTIQG